MGCIRLLLAMAVVMDHSAPLFGMPWVPGWVAVEAFFMISGFYMMMILQTKYPDTPEGRRLFWENRFLRIYPVYWTILSISIIWNLLSIRFPAWVHSVDVLSIWSVHGFLDGGRSIYLALSNCLIFGLDLGFFVNFDEHVLAFTKNVWPHNLHAFRFYFIPQAWSLSLEMMIYVIAPFLFRLRPWALGTIATVCLGCRTLVMTNGYYQDPWTYRFFPFELGMFCVGALLFVMMRHWRLERYRTAGLTAIAVASLAIIFEPHLPGLPIRFLGYEPEKETFLVVLALCIPFAFAASKHWRIDGALGELSFPTYLVFGIVIGQCNGDFSPLGIKPVLGSLIVAAIVTRTLDLPLNRIRQRRVRRLLLAPERVAKSVKDEEVAAVSFGAKM